MRKMMMKMHGVKGADDAITYQGDAYDVSEFLGMSVDGKNLN